MEKLKEILTSKVATSILVFIFIFYAGWTAAETFIEFKYKIPTDPNYILGVFSLLLGIYYLYKLGKK
ncbi:hypothetical protein [Lactobacillus equicursoris]|uniref:hypothetical protein n=1 Tax=Lactobacillus equicursoris TaxID=420645 RepID=UPI0039947C0F